MISQSTILQSSKKMKKKKKNLENRMINRIKIETGTKRSKMNSKMILVHKKMKNNKRDTRKIMGNKYRKPKTMKKKW